MPNAHKDQNAFLRDVLEDDKKVRLFTFMFRKKLGLLFKRSCVRTDPQDPTPAGYMSLNMFTDALVGCRVPLSLKDLALIFLQVADAPHRPLLPPPTVIPIALPHGLTHHASRHAAALHATASIAAEPVRGLRRVRRRR